MAAMEMEKEKALAAGWFKELRNEIVSAFEEIEACFSDQDAPQRFEIRQTKRGDGSEDQGGGLMSVLRGGTVFEKVGVNVSEVYGLLGDKATQAMRARGISGLEDDNRFWASGISLVAHMANPHCPAVHMNTRMFWTPGAWWFGGGADLNPAFPYREDTEHFHSELRFALSPFGGGLYQKLSDWADEYFYIPHRARPRGVGGIFVDDWNSGNWDNDFQLIQAIGRAFLPAFLPLIEKRQRQTCSEAEREAQLAYRGLYAEYNLVYDRGTKFGLATGHDPDAVLMSLPPLARWP